MLLLKQRRGRGLTSPLTSAYYDNGGTFVVAVTRDTGQVVGVVGAQYKQTVDGRKLFQLRRMSIHSQARGLGVGGQLVHFLESQLQDMSEMYLYCSNVQDPARRLYHRLGFQITDSSDYRDWPRGFQVCRFEKRYDG